VPASTAANGTTRRTATMSAPRRDEKRTVVATAGADEHCSLKSTNMSSSSSVMSTSCARPAMHVGTFRRDQAPLSRAHAHARTLAMATVTSAFSSNTAKSSKTQRKEATLLWYTSCNSSSRVLHTLVT
jgi:hypothetical protein